MSKSKGKELKSNSNSQRNSLTKKLIILMKLSKQKKILETCGLSDMKRNKVSIPKLKESLSKQKVT